MYPRPSTVSVQNQALALSHLRSRQNTETLHFSNKIKFQMDSLLLNPDQCSQELLDIHIQILDDVHECMSLDLKYKHSNEMAEILNGSNNNDLKSSHSNSSKLNPQTDGPASLNLNYDQAGRSYSQTLNPQIKQVSLVREQNRLEENLLYKKQKNERETLLTFPYNLYIQHLSQDPQLFQLRKTQRINHQIERKNLSEAHSINTSAALSKIKNIIHNHHPSLTNRFDHNSPPITLQNNNQTHPSNNNQAENNNYISTDVVNIQTEKPSQSQGNSDNNNNVSHVVNKENVDNGSRGSLETNSSHSRKENDKDSVSSDSKSASTFSSFFACLICCNTNKNTESSPANYNSSEPKNIPHINTQVNTNNPSNSFSPSNTTKNMQKIAQEQIDT